MVTVGYKDGKVQYNDSTGKQCEGCCAPPTEECGFCTGGAPIQVFVSYRVGLCQDCLHQPTGLTRAQSWDADEFLVGTGIATFVEQEQFWCQWLGPLDDGRLVGTISETNISIDPQCGVDIDGTSEYGDPVVSIRRFETNLTAGVVLQQRTLGVNKLPTNIGAVASITGLTDEDACIITEEMAVTNPACPDLDAANYNLFSDTGSLTLYAIDSCDGAATWSAGTYNYGDIVLHSGSCYICMVASTTSTPGTDTEWVLIE